MESKRVKSNLKYFLAELEHETCICCTKTCRDCRMLAKLYGIKDHEPLKLVQLTLQRVVIPLAQDWEGLLRHYLTTFAVLSVAICRLHENLHKTMLKIRIYFINWSHKDFNNQSWRQKVQYICCYSLSRWMNKFVCFIILYKLRSMKLSKLVSVYEIISCRMLT